MMNLRCCDAKQLLQSFEDESVDLIITDPPYESLEKHRKKGTTTRLKESKGSSNPWFEVVPNSYFEDFFSLAYQKLKQNSHLYFFCDQETMFAVKPMAEAAGFTFWKPIVWDKKKIGMGYHYRARYEFILFFEKGKRKLNNLSIPDVLEVPRIINGYPTEKPVELCEILILQSSNEGDLVVDPFMGSGSCGLAAKRTNRHFIGSDTKEDAVNVSINRINELVDIPKEM